MVSDGSCVNRPAKGECKLKKLNNIERLSKDYEKKYGIKYADTSSLSYKIVKWVFFAVCLFAAFTSFAAVFGTNLYLSSNPDSAALFKTDMIIIFVSSAVLLLSGIFMLFKKSFISLPLYLISAVYQLIKFKSWMTGADMTAGLHGDYWWRHFIPLILGIILALICFFIHLTSKIKANRSYKAVLEKIYLRFPEKKETLSEAEWTEFLKGYNPDSISERE